MNSEELEIMYWLGKFSKKTTYKQAVELLNEFKQSMYYLPIFTLETGVREFINTKSYINSYKN